MNALNSGSVRALWRVSLPLIISFLSEFLMLFVDRMYLSWYNLDALKAATSMGTFAWALFLGPITVATMAEVFIAQYNGAKLYGRLAQPMWQMLYFSLFCIPVYLVITLWGYYTFTGYEAEYFCYLVPFGPAFIAVNALQAFLIGQGKTSVIKWIGLLYNVINIVLDPLFIFGYGIFPSLGAAGAALTTGLGQVVAIFVLIKVIFTKENRAHYGMSDRAFQWTQMKEILRVATPTALFVTFEILGWTAFYWMMERVSSLHMLVAATVQSVLLLFLFFGIGLEKGISAIAGNLIGSRNLQEMHRLIRSACILILLFGGVIAVALIGFPDLFIACFDVSERPEAIPAIKYAFIVLVLYLTLENFRFLFGALLTAAGDTKFLMVSGILTIWGCMVLPTYLFVMRPGAPVERAYSIYVGFAIIATLANYVRYRQGKWKEKTLIHEAIPGTDGGSGQSLLPEGD